MKLLLVKRFMPLILILVALLLVMGLLVRLMENRLVYFPTQFPENFSGASNYGLDLENVFLATSDGKRIHGWFHPAPESDSTLLWFHGNAGNLTDRLGHLQTLSLLGINIFSIDYRGYGKARKPLLPMIAVPTTAGTGSEAQSYAVIADSTTHMKMACGDPKLAFAVAVLDPELTLSQPASVSAIAGYDAISHAVETAVTTRRTPISELFSREAFRLLDGHYTRVLNEPKDILARGAMHLGAFFAGAAIEQSMLGAAHACANPLTARYDLAHGVALAILLPHVVRWNSQANEELYRDLVRDSIQESSDVTPGSYLATRLVDIGRAGGLPLDLRTTGVKKKDLSNLAESASQQWTGSFNPRPFGAHEALEVYQCAF